MNPAVQPADASPWEVIRALRRSRPRSRLVRASALCLALLVAASWFSVLDEPGAFLSPRRRANLSRFIAQEALPAPLRESTAALSTRLADTAAWAADLCASRGAEALAATLAIALCAMALAGAFALLAAPLGARTLCAARPFDQRAPQGLPWRLVTSAARLSWILLRAIPEYIWAFLLLAILGPSAWPAILALAIHNAGILARLGADVAEDVERGPLAALAAAGARRSQIAATALPPLALPRFLLLFFYRFETCVREATVLGLLGVLSLGYWIQDARARQHADEMLFFVLLGALLVIVGDAASAAVRRRLR
jgi:phosphonate transport system permease protein